MGGFGSGKWPDVVTRKVNTGLCRTLNVKGLKELGMFDCKDNNNERFSIGWVNELGEHAGSVTITPQADGNGNIRTLRIDYRDSVTVTRQTIRITSTPCFLGGQRYWFLCPAVVEGVLCENRVGVLYLPPAGGLFACRHCWGLTYESCQQSHKYDRVFDHIKDMDTANLNINQMLRLGGL